MSQHSVELVAKFKDNATPGLRRLAAEAEKTGSRQLQKAAAVKLKHQEMYSATARLGIRTEHQIRREIQQTQAAYNRLATRTGEGCTGNAQPCTRADCRNQRRCKPFATYRFGSPDNRARCGRRGGGCGGRGLCIGAAGQPDDGL